MIKSMDDRFSGKSVKPMQKQLTAVDLDELVSLCCGHKNGTSVVLTRFNLKNMERKNFCPSGHIFAVFPTSRVWMDYSKEN